MSIAAGTVTAAALATKHIHIHIQTPSPSRGPTSGVVVRLGVVQDWRILKTSEGTIHLWLSDGVECL
jgi:hypothetical protein